MLSTLLYVALAGTKLLQNDNFNGAGTVNSAVSFGEYEGAAVMFTPDAGYPAKIIAIDVLSVTYNQGTPGAIAGYQLDVWDEQDGFIDPPRARDGGRYPPRVQTFVQLTTSASQFNRINLPSPITLDAGRLFVSLGEQLSTMDTSATVAIDTSPLVPGHNWYREGVGTFTRIDRPDGGFYRGINHNWIIRAVVEVPDQPVTVTSVFPDRGPNTMPTPVVISGTNFELTATAYLGSQPLTVTGRTATTISATVPAALAPGPYTVRVENSATNFGTLPNGYTVLTGDGGTGGGAGGGGGTGGGVAGGGPGGGTGGSGGSGGVLRLDDITPNEGDNAEVTKVVLTGDGFQTGAQVIIGTTVLDSVMVRSAAVINAEVPAGLAPGDHDVVVINLDGNRDTLRNGFTATVATKSGCGCGFSGLEPLLLLLALPRLRRRAAVTRGGPQHGEGPPRP